MKIVSTWTTFQTKKKKCLSVGNFGIVSVARPQPTTAYVEACPYARYNCKLWNCIFWVFLYIIDEHSCLNYCIFTKLSQILCLISVLILLCQRAKFDCRLWKVLAFFWEFFIYYYMRLKRYQTFTKCMYRDQKQTYVTSV